MTQDEHTGLKSKLSRGVRIVVPVVVAGIAAFYALNERKTHSPSMPVIWDRMEVCDTDRNPGLDINELCKMPPHDLVSVFEYGSTAYKNEVGIVKEQVTFERAYETLKNMPTEKIA